MTAKKRKGLLVAVILFMSYFSKKVTFVYLGYKDFLKKLLMKENNKKIYLNTFGDN